MSKNQIMAMPDGFDENKLQLLKDTVCKGSNNEEFELFVHACKRTGLDPFMRQIYAVKRWNSALKREEMTIQVGIDGFRLIAARTGKYMPGKNVKYKFNGNRLVSATSYVKKFSEMDKSWHVIAATAFYDEYVQVTKEGRPTRFWSKMPKVMLAKVAEALALRKAFPAELSGLYTSEEMQQASNDQVQIMDTETVEKYEKAEAEKNDRLSEDKIHQIEAALDAAGALEEDINELFNWKRIGDLSQLNERDFNDCMNFIKHIKNKRSVKNDRY